MMSLLLGGGFDAPRTPSMSRGDEELVSAGNSGGNDPHGDVS